MNTADRNVIHQKLKELAMALKNRPLMNFSGEINIYSFRIFLHGYSKAMYDFTGFDLLRTITEWLCKKKELTLNIHWTEYAERFSEDLTDEGKRKYLIEILENYIYDVFETK